MSYLSPLRGRLASFEHAYVLATRLRRVTDHHQFVIWTGDAMQPVRIAWYPPGAGEALLALVL